MNKQDQADWEFWKRVTSLLGTQLHGWSYQDCADFIDPQMDVDGGAAAKLIEQEYEV